MRQKPKLNHIQKSNSILFMFILLGLGLVGCRQDDPRPIQQTSEANLLTQTHAVTQETSATLLREMQTQDYLTAFPNALTASLAPSLTSTSSFTPTPRPTVTPTLEPTKSLATIKYEARNAAIMTLDSSTIGATQIPISDATAVFQQLVSSYLNDFSEATIDARSTLENQMQNRILPVDINIYMATQSSGN